MKEVCFVGDMILRRMGRLDESTRIRISESDLFMMLLSILLMITRVCFREVKRCD